MADQLDDERSGAEEVTEQARKQREAQQARQEAERRITEVESQGNINLRAEPGASQVGGND